MTDDSSIRPAFNKLTFEQVVLDTTLKMRDAESSKDWDKAFCFFKYTSLFLSNHLSKEDQDYLEGDWENLYCTIDTIEDMPDSVMAQKTKLDKINEVKRYFMETHMRYIMMAFPRANIINVDDDGALNFEQINYRGIRGVIRMSSASNAGAIDEQIHNKAITERDLVKEEDIEDTNEDVKYGNPESDPESEPSIKRNKRGGADSEDEIESPPEAKD